MSIGLAERPGYGRVCACLCMCGCARSQAGGWETSEGTEGRGKRVGKRRGAAQVGFHGARGL